MQKLASASQIDRLPPFSNPDSPSQCQPIRNEKSMKAILIQEPGGAEKLYLGEAPLPEMGTQELRVKVAATAINRADTMQREGNYPVPPGASPILGLEMAGEVEAIGNGVTKWRVGDRVFALLAGGGYAEYAVIHEDMALPVPQNMSLEQAAGIAEVYLTAMQGLFWLGELAPQENVLIHAGASGVGTAAIQLAKLQQSHVIVTASSAAKLKTCQDLGADVAINYKEADFVEKVREATAGQGADVILDFVAAAYFQRNLNCIALDGRLVILSLLGGTKVENWSLGQLMQKRLKVMGSTLRNRSFDYKVKLSQDFAARFLPKFETGDLQVVVDSVLSWHEVQKAHERLENNLNTGKIILKIQP